MSTKKKLGLVVAFKRGIFKKLWKGLIFVTLLTSLLSLLHHEVPGFHLEIGAQLPGYMGAALGLLLVFRNNTAYDKWWEARKEIGALVNTCRNIGITINGVLPHEQKEKYAIAALVKAFVYAMKEHLREGVKMKEVYKTGIEQDDLEKIEKANHKPVVIANLMMNRLETLYQQKHITDIQQQTLIHQITLLVDILGRCERIRNTPIPMAYGFLLKFFITIYVVVLPLGMLTELGWGCIPLVMFLYYLMMSIVLTAEEIEEPFGLDVNDLPMETMAANISKNIDELVEHH